MRDRRRLAAALAGALLLTACAAASAAAHAVVQPSASRPAQLQRYTLTVPNERSVPTVSVRLEVPDGIDFFIVEDKPGWTTRLEKRGGRTAAVVFDGGSIRAGFYDTFRFIARNPAGEGAIAWNVRQGYRGGAVADWSGPPGSDTPASRTLITEAATPADTVDVASGRQSAAPASVDGEAPTGNRDWVAFVIALAALVIALIVVCIPMFRGRPPA